MMEQWFVFTVVSAVLTGFQVFTNKVAAERDYDAALVNTYAAIIAALTLLTVSLAFTDVYYLSSYILGLLAISAVLYMAANLTRHAALQAIDTTIFFPVYKVLGPALVILFGIILFSESFNKTEWIGLVLSLAVPILLISRSENVRQKDLIRGLKLLLITVFFTSIAAIISKEMAIKTENIWFLIAIGDVMLAIVGVLIFRIKNRRESLIERVRFHSNRPVLILSLWMGFLQAIAFALLMFAYTGGPVGIIYTVHSLYILIPIILSIIFYKEHWNARKVLAIVLSVAALALLQ